MNLAIKRIFTIASIETTIILLRFVGSNFWKLEYTEHFLPKPY